MLLDGVPALAILALALLLDRVVGDPDWLWSRLPHPVVWFGRLIGWLDRRLNNATETPEQRRRSGRVALWLMIVLACVAGVVLWLVFRSLGPIGLVLEVVVVAIFLAQKSLADHVAAVAMQLTAGGLAAGRQAVSRIVGRDPETLDEAGVSRAAIESLAENFSDGVVAPALWYAVCGLPGLIIYKMLNTADSMIGHKSERHLDFGRAAAIADDWANWPAARLSALLIVLAALVRKGRGASLRAFRTARSDARHHRSPNAGWPEAAMAGALDLSLAGPRVYGGVLVDEPMLHAGGRLKASPAAIQSALTLFRTACTIGLVLVVLTLVVLA